MRPATFAVLAFLAQPSGKELAGKVWHWAGTWTSAGRTVQFSQTVEPRALTCVGADSFLWVLRNGEISRLSCNAGKAFEESKHPLAVAAKRDSGSPAPTSWSKRFELALASLKAAPAYAMPMSRAAGWRNAVVERSPDGMVDMAPVFAAALPRRVDFELCGVETGDCLKGLSVDLAQSSRVNLAGVALTTYRLVSSDQGNEAWVRIVGAGDGARAAAEYREAVAVIRSWELPAAAQGAPSLQRLERMALAAVGRE